MSTNPQVQANNSSLTVEQQIRAMCEANPTLNLKKMLKSIGVEVAEDLFEVFNFQPTEKDGKTPKGNPVPMLKIEKVTKAVGGVAFRTMVENLPELLTFALDYQATFKIDFGKLNQEKLLEIFNLISELEQPTKQ